MEVRRDVDNSFLPVPFVMTAKAAILTLNLIKSHPNDAYHVTYCNNQPLDSHERNPRG
jgi:hypothetical protein